jgi:aminopeptidase N
MVKHLKKLLILLGLLPAVLSGQQHHSCPLDQYLGKVYENPLNDQYLSKYDVKFYHLSLEVSNKSTFLDGFATILSEVLKDMDTIVFQLNGALGISDVHVNGTPVEGFLHADEVVYVPFDAGEGEMISVQIFYNGTAGKERGFFAGITSAYDNTNKQWVTYTLSEPLNARDWFPVKQVLADKADSVWVDLICDRELMAGSIGLLEEIEELPDNKHKFKWRSNYPIAYYLISLAVADYRDYSFHAALSDRNDSVLVQNYIYDDDDYFMTWKSRIDRTGDMITLFSDLVMDYPFAKEKYGHAVAPMGGGMEHQTMSTMANFNFNLVAHELAHQWFGNSVTCGTWQDIWINEGFASYFEYIALDYLNSREAANNWMEYAMTLAIGKSGSVYVPESEAEDVYRVFDYGLSYKKGAVLLHMIRYELNDDALFFNVLNTYSEIYRDSVATAVEFREVLENVSGRDFTCFFDQWYYGKGYPTFQLLGRVENDTLYVRSQQETSDTGTSLFIMHFDLAVETSEGTMVYRLFQESNDQLFAIPMTAFVYDIQFDPEKWLLARSSSEMALPEGRDYLLGPNPFTQSITFKFRKPDNDILLRIFDIEGKSLVTHEVFSNPYEMELGSLGNGSYILMIEGPWGVHKEKIVKISSR